MRCVCVCVHVCVCVCVGGGGGLHMRAILPQCHTHQVSCATVSYTSRELCHSVIHIKGAVPQ